MHNPSIELSSVRVLGAAFERQQLVLHYQPIMNLRSNRAFAVEALVRWPGHSGVGSSLLVTQLEQLGLTLPFGRWLLETACRQVKAWQNQGHDGLAVAINLTTGQFWQADFKDQIRQTLAATGLAPQSLMLEIEEPALVGDVDEVKRRLEDLKNIGVQLAIDNFGTGYSSLNHLKQFPLNWLKLSRTFIYGVADSPNDAAIATSVISLGHSLGLRVIAVGAETESQMGFIRERRCDAVQSHYFVPALAAASVSAWLERSASLPNPPLSAERTVLVLDDDEALASWLSMILERSGFTVISARTAEQALGELAQCPVDVLIADYVLPGMNGVSFLSRVRTIYPNTVRIMLSGVADMKVLTKAINEAGIFQFLPKSLSEEQLLNTVREAFDMRDTSIKLQGI